MYYCTFEANLAVNVQSTLSSSTFLFSSSVRIHGERSFKPGTISRRVAAIILICLEFVPLYLHRFPLFSHRPRKFFRARHPSSLSSTPFFTRYTPLFLFLLRMLVFHSTRSLREAYRTDQQNHRLPIGIIRLRSIYHRTFAMLSVYGQQK